MSAGVPQPPDLRSSGERIEQLLGSFAGAGLRSQERAEELVRVVAELYGAGLQRVLEILDHAGVLTVELLDRLGDDELVGSLLLVHGLHPHGLRTRIEHALERVRPTLAAQGADVELLAAADDGLVRLRLRTGGHGCASSSAPLKAAVAVAVEASAPEVTRIDYEEVGREREPAVIPVESLLLRTRASA
jgi:Fe-S cluster biogenesis protein NfuA